MIKRPLHSQFSDAVRGGRKITTIRDKAWPVGVPIMLYQWSEKPYRSPQIDVAPILVTGFWPIYITQTHGGGMSYRYGMETPAPLWEHEGFFSPEGMDEWFRPMVEPGEMITKVLMRFRLLDRNAM